MTSPSPSPPRKAIVIGISGCSSSGKTTLSRLLRDIFPGTFVLHEDDFYREEGELPMKDGLLDWDCAEALNLPDMIKSLTHIHQEGTFPPDLDSKEDQNSIGSCPVSLTKITSLKTLIKNWTSPTQPGHLLLSATKPLKLCIFDGFLLYSRSMSTIQPLLDIKIFLRVSYAKAKERREKRSGYVTLEGFWEDPEGYVDRVVWPNYVRDHEWLFEGGDVEGGLREGVRVEEGIRVFAEGEGEGGGKGDLDVGMEELLEWVVRLLMEELPKVVGGEKGM